MNVISINRTRLDQMRTRTEVANNLQRFRTLNERWVVEADRRLTIYAGWFWCGEIPEWVSEAWINYVRGARHGLGHSAEPHEADWPDWWLGFVIGALSHDHEYKRQLAVRLHGVEGLA